MSSNTNPPKRSPRAMPVETIITRYKSAQRQMQLKKNHVKNVTKPKTSEKDLLKTLKQGLKAKLQLKRLKSAEKCSTLIEIDDDAYSEFYPNKPKRNAFTKKIVLSPKVCLKIIGGTKSTNKRKLHVPQRDIKYIETKRTRSQLVESDFYLESPKSKPDDTELSINEMMLKIEEQGGLDEEGLLEILTCPSPVWWEDPPAGYIEEPIFARTKPVEQQSIKNQLLEEQKKEAERKEIMAKEESVSLNVQNDLNVENLDISKFDIDVENRGVNFISKRCKLESLLGNIKNKVKNDCNKNTEQNRNITNDLRNHFENIQDTTNVTKSEREKKISDSFEDDHIFDLEDEEIVDLENIDIPIGPGNNTRQKIESSPAKIEDCELTSKNIIKIMSNHVSEFKNNQVNVSGNNNNLINLSNMKKMKALCSKTKNKDIQRVNGTDTFSAEIKDGLPQYVRVKKIETLCAKPMNKNEAETLSSENKDMLSINLDKDSTKVPFNTLDHEINLESEILDQNVTEIKNQPSQIQYNIRNKVSDKDFSHGKLRDYIISGNIKDIAFKNVNDIISNYDRVKKCETSSVIPQNNATNDEVKLLFTKKKFKSAMTVNNTIATPAKHSDDISSARSQIRNDDQSTENENNVNNEKTEKVVAAFKTKNEASFIPISSITNDNEIKSLSSENNDNISNVFSIKTVDAVKNDANVNECVANKFANVNIIQIVDQTKEKKNNCNKVNKIESSLIRREDNVISYQAKETDTFSLKNENDTSNLNKEINDTFISKAQNENNVPTTINGNKTHDIYLKEKDTSNLVKIKDIISNVRVRTIENVKPINKIPLVKIREVEDQSSADNNVIMNNRINVTNSTTNISNCIRLRKIETTAIRPSKDYQNSPAQIESIDMKEINDSLDKMKDDSPVSDNISEDVTQSDIFEDDAIKDYIRHKQAENNQVRRNSIQSEGSEKMNMSEEYLDLSLLDEDDQKMESEDDDAMNDCKTSQDTDTHSVEGSIKKHNRDILDEGENHVKNKLNECVGYEEYLSSPSSPKPNELSQKNSTLNIENKDSTEHMVGGLNSTTVYKMLNSESKNEFNSQHIENKYPEVSSCTEVSSDNSEALKTDKVDRLINYYYKQQKAWINNKNKINKFANDTEVKTSSDCMSCSFKNKSIMISDNSVKYCLLCSSIFDTDECRYCLRKFKKYECTCKKTNEAEEYVCAVCNITVKSKSDIIKHLSASKCRT